MSGTGGMRAMVLAAGRGERLRPLTDRTPKPLLRVRGAALVEHHLHALAAAGFAEVVVNTAWLGERIEAALGDGRAYGLRIRYSRETPGALDTGGGVRNALPLLGEGEFAVINADILTDFDYARLRRPLSADAEARLVLVPNPPHHPAGDFGLDGDRVTSTPRHTFAGIGVYRPRLFADYGCERFGLAAALRPAIAAGRVAGELYRGTWHDVGTPEALERLEGEHG